MRFKKINLPCHPVGETVQMYTGYEIPFVNLFRNLNYTDASVFNRIPASYPTVKDSREPVYRQSRIPGSLQSRMVGHQSIGRR